MLFAVLAAAAADADAACNRRGSSNFVVVFVMNVCTMASRQQKYTLCV